MSDPNNILSFRDDGKAKLSEEQIMAWLEGKLSMAEQHEVEKWLAEEGMESDALEGLKKVMPDDTRHIVNKLNHNLRKAIVSKKRKRRAMETNQFTWIAILVVLLLVVVAYLVIRKAI